MCNRSSRSQGVSVLFLTFLVLLRQIKNFVLNAIYYIYWVELPDDGKEEHFIPLTYSVLISCCGIARSEQVSGNGNRKCVAKRSTYLLFNNSLMILPKLGCITKTQ